MKLLESGRDSAFASLSGWAFFEQLLKYWIV
jgi:hypothetical protein